MDQNRKKPNTFDEWCKMDGPSDIFSPLFHLVDKGDTNWISVKYKLPEVKPLEDNSKWLQSEEVLCLEDYGVEMPIDRRYCCRIATARITPEGYLEWLGASRYTVAWQPLPIMAIS